MLLQVKPQNIVTDRGDKFIILGEERDSFLSYRIENHTLDLYCAFVPEESRGNGHATSLISFALQYAVLNELWVKPNCAAVKAYLKLYPEWRYLITR